MNIINSLNLFGQIYLFIIIATVGLCIGSFLNVVALRFLSEESIVFPGSKCPKCNNNLAWYDNIPVLSFFLLLGKCRQCKEKISVQYPIVEIITALLFIAIFVVYGISIKALCLVILMANLVVISITDIKEKVIFDLNSIPLIPLGLAYNFFHIGNETFVSAIIGAIIGAAFFEIFSRLGLLLVGQYAFGAGDSILAAALGAWFGWKAIIIILILSFILQLFVGIPIIFTNMYKDKDYKSIIFLIMLMGSILTSYAGQLLGLSGNANLSLLAILASFILATIGVIGILNRTKKRQSFTFVPFGPALVLAGFIIMFYGQYFENLIF